MQKFLNSTTHTVAWFAKRQQSGELELKAPFQRNLVWSPKQKSYLVDTILRGYPIPELYIQEFTDAEGNDKYIVVDGQQRLRSCFEFIADEFEIDGSDSPDFADMTFSNLEADLKKEFYGYSFVVRVLPEMADTELRAMFQRLNRNVVALNRQELRHATFWGEFISSVEKIADDDRWTQIRLFTPNDVRRMLDIEYISELAIGYLHGLQNKKESLDDWYKSYEKEYPRKDEVETMFNVVISEILAVLPDIANYRWRKKSDFHSLFLSLSRHYKLFPLPRDGRVLLRDQLIKFSGQVDEAIAAQEGMMIEKGTENAHKYARGIEKAASDLGSRKVRDLALSEFLAPLIT